MTGRQLTVELLRNSFVVMISNNNNGSEPIPEELRRNSSGIGFHSLAQFVLIVAHLVTAALLSYMLAVTFPAPDSEFCQNRHSGICSGMAQPILWIAAVVVIIIGFNFILLLAIAYNTFNNYKTDARFENCYIFTIITSLVLLALDTTFSGISSFDLPTICCSVSLALFLCTFLFYLFTMHHVEGTGERQRLV